MALLRMEPMRINRFGLYLVLAVTAFAGCALFGSIWSGEKPFTFPHKVHYEDEGLDCSDCHSNYEDDDNPGLPNLRQCMLCHEEIDAEKPPDRQISVFFVGNEFQPQRVSALSPEIIFSHRLHAISDHECSACHVGIETNESVSDLPVPTMAACTECHVQNRIPADCSTCHSELGVGVPPPTHAYNWLTTHGKVVRAESQTTVNDCSLCHTQTTCVTCHQDEPPPSHNNFFRIGGHGIVASMDRRNCAECHRSDFCDRCHSEAQPLSHVPAWGSPVDLHCTVCHFPLATPGQSCVVCHKGTPSHDLAAAMPPWHNPAMNCRQCHGLTAPLPHPDPGVQCTLCHR